MAYIFLDTISPKWVILLFDEVNRNIISQKTLDILWNESSKLIQSFDEFLGENGLIYGDIKNIIVVNGPGSFTWVRTTILMVNTIAFATGTKLTPITYFDLFSNFPIIKTSSKRDVFYKSSRESEIEIISNDEVLKRLVSCDTYFGDFLVQGKTAISLPDYENILKNIILDNKKILQPYYIKKPSIS